MLVFMVVLAIVGPSLRPYGFEERGVGPRLLGPTRDHWFGTDNIGRDLFVRATRGARTSLLIAAIVAILSVSFGAVLGAIAGYFGRHVDGIISFFTNLILTIPFYAILLVFGVKFGAEPVSISIIIALLVWTRVRTRIVRAPVPRPVASRSSSRPPRRPARPAGASSSATCCRTRWAPSWSSSP